MYIYFFYIVIIVLITTIVYLNVFTIIADAIIVGIYPYLIGIALLIGSLLILEKFIKKMILVKTIKICLGLILLFAIFTFIQVWRNAQLLNGYQSNRSEYMDELMQLTHTENKNELFEEIDHRGIATLVEKNTGIPLTYNNRAMLFYDGNKIFDEMIEAIHQAKHHIHIEYYIIRDDDIGKKIKDILIDKAKQGVKVRIIYDGLGSYKLKTKFRSKLKKAGVEIKAHDNIYMSILNGKLNHRNHRKILIVDGKIGFAGGVNIGDEYLSKDEKIGKWKDLKIKIEGESVNWLQKIFLGDWYYITGEKIIDEKYFPKHEQLEKLPIQVITSGYDTHWNEISQAYFSIITTAKESVYIITPYLVLSDSMLKALQTASMRGVNVKILMPEEPDLFLVKWANASFFEELLKANVQVYLYQNGFLHTKALIADEKILSVGSANFNTRSLYLDYEINTIIFDEKLSKQMIEEFYKNLAESEQIELKNYEKISFVTRLKYIIGKLITPLT